MNIGVAMGMGSTKGAEAFVESESVTSAENVDMANSLLIWDVLG